MTEDSNKQVTAAVRAIAAIDALASEARPLTNLELAERLSIAPSSALMLMRALCAAGFAIRDPRTKRFWLSPRSADIGGRLHRMAAPGAATDRLVQRLADVTGESVCLAVQFETRIEIARITRNARGDRFTLKEGMLMPLLGTGAGVCILSLMSRNARTALIRRCRSYGDSFGPGRRSVADLEQAIARVRAQGYLMEYIEAEGGIGGVAFPLRLHMPTRRYGAIIVGGRALNIRPREQKLIADTRRLLGRHAGVRTRVKDSCG